MRFIIVQLVGLLLQVIVTRCSIIVTNINDKNCTISEEKKTDTEEKHEAGYQEKCYDGLGCVVLTPEWTDPKNRPVNVLPCERYAVNTMFILWKLNDNITYEVLGNSDMRCLPDLLPCQTLLIHDFTSNGYTGWIMHLARAFLSECQDMNVISVDWGAGAQPPYVLAVANARLVALEIVHFLNRMKAAADKVHIVGHGLGAHIAGYVGKLIAVNKITALDPSGPYFSSMPPHVRLHKNDAKYVEVIHTDSTCMGTSEIIGHVDYFPNDGKNQPGCIDTCRRVTSIQRNDLELGETLSACSHKRALKYYIEAVINPSCLFTGVACQSYKDFVKGKCTSCGEKMQHCHSLRPHSFLRNVNNTNGFYFITANSAPFCGEMVKVLIILNTRKCGQKKGIIKGYFKVTVKQDTEDVTFLLNENHVISALRANVHYMFLVFRTIPPSLNLPAKALHMKWLTGPLPFAWSAPPRVSSVMITKLTDCCNETMQWFCPVTGLSSVGRCGVGLEPCHAIAADEIEVTTMPTTLATEPFECY